MRVLAVSWAVSDHAHGGEAVASYELVRHLALEGVDVDVVTPLLDLERPFPANVRTFPVRGGPRPGNTGANKWAMLRQARSLQEIATYDVTHVVSQYTSFPIGHRPFVISGCWVFPPREQNLPRPSGGRQLREKLANGPLSHRLDVVRDVAYALVEERFRGWDRARTLREADLVIVRQRLGVEPMSRQARRVEHVPFGIDPDLFPYSAEPREPVVLYAGNLKPYKNVEGLLEAFRLVREQVPEARLRIAGDGPERPGIEALASRLGVRERVDFLGHVPRYALAEEFQRAAVFALPSLGESFGQVCLEAMACGTPVVASDRISGAFDFMEEGVNGHVTTPYDPRAVADALARVLTDSGAARRMAPACRRTAERFSWREIARRHVALYQSL